MGGEGKEVHLNLSHFMRGKLVDEICGLFKLEKGGKRSGSVFEDGPGLRDGYDSSLRTDRMKAFGS